MNIYFAGSIRGGRTDAELYHRMIERMKAQGHAVLTEHVGDLSLSTLEAGGLFEAEIYKQDTDWLRASDLLIAECTTPSLGVGYELAYAERHNVPCHLFYDPTRCRMSAMLAGNPYFHLHPYTSEPELLAVLDKLLA